MARFISGICFFLMCSYVYAQEAKDAPPPETMNILGIIAFAVLFFGLCIGFGVHMWRHNKVAKQEQE